MTPDPIHATRAPAPDVSALLAAGAETVARYQAQNDALRAELDTAHDLLRRLTIAGTELQWAVESTDVHAAGQAMRALREALADARRWLQ